MAPDDLPSEPVDETVLESIAQRLADRVDRIGEYAVKFDAGSDGRLWMSVGGEGDPTDVDGVRGRLADEVRRACGEEGAVDFELYARPLGDRVEFCAELRRES